MSNWGFAQSTVDLDTMEVQVLRLHLERTENDAGKQVRKNSDDIRRATILQAEMIAQCRGHAIACVEVPHGSQSARAMASYGMCIGVLASCPIPIIEVKALEVKEVSGYKHATKEEMILWAIAQEPDAEGWLVKRSGEPTAANEHLADAVAAIYAGILTNQFKQAAALFRSISTPTSNL